MKRVMVWSAVIIALLTVAVVAVRSYQQHQVAKRIAITSPNGMASLEKVRLGGVDQWVQIRGHDRTKPVLLFLHSGPGFPEMPFSHVNAALEREFVVVHWDQRGAGKSYSFSIPPNSMNVEQFVSDTHELSELLIRRFGGHRIFLVAHSWGTLIGALTVSHYPELFYAYVGIGQVADMPASEKWAYQFAVDKAQKSGNERAIGQLKTIGEPPYKTLAHYYTMQNWVMRLAAQRRYEPDTAQFVWLAFCSPAYSWRDLLSIPLGLRFSFSKLWREAFYHANLFRQVPRIDVPVYFFEGRHDYTVPVTAALAERYFQALDAPKGKRLIWFEHSAHFPQLEEPKEYRRVLVDEVLRTRRE
jgi:pimeloyl-ACP methyl ester carboxylesterase